MAGLKFVGRDIRVASIGLSHQAIARRMAEVSRQAVAEAIARGEGTESRTTIVNGRVGAAEESVTPPGPIVVKFNWWEEVALYAIEFASARSPVDSGDYRDSWFVLADGEMVAPENIPPAARMIVVTNDKPYHRKIDVGHMRNMSVPPGIIEDTRQAVNGRYGNMVLAEVGFVELAGGYILKGRQYSSAKKFSAHIRHNRGRAVATKRKDSKRGQAMTYPAVEISLR